jgi:SAM-dependent methyltransferase
VLPGIALDAAILDVGRSRRTPPAELHALGYRRVFGIDLDIAGMEGRADGPAFFRGAIVPLRTAANGASRDPPPSRFDLVMFHHSFEHIADPRAALAAAMDLLAPGGRVLIRIPIASSYAFVRYRANWVQLDAPRHLHLFTERSFRLLSESLGLRIVETFYDSTAFQFWGSEQYELGVPLRSVDSFQDNPQTRLFDQRRISAFAKEAHRLNRAGKGDQVGFVLRKDLDGSPRP